MKPRYYFIINILVIFMTIPLYAQSIRQQGVTYRYNGKNQRTPIGGVYIKPAASSNGEVSDEKTGAFTLVLNNLKMGSRIGNVQISKQGMMVFNQQAVDEWSVRKDPLCIILCNTDEFQKQKENLINIGKNQAKKKYDRQLDSLKKQNEASQLLIADYYNRLDSLEKEYRNALTNMDRYAEVFARIDKSEVDTIAQRAIDMFNRGEIEESIHLLEQQNYMEKLKLANRTIEQADAMISSAEQAKNLAEEDKQKYIEGLRTQIAGYKLQNEWLKAKELLKGLADNLDTYEAIADYADFCYILNDFSNAEKYYLKYLDKITDSSDMDETVRSYMFATIRHALASLYFQTNRFIESEFMYNSAMEIYEFLVMLHPNLFESDLAQIEMNLAGLYSKARLYDESEKLYKSAYDIYERCAKMDSTLYTINMAQVQSNLATLYAETRQYSESEKMYKDALGIYSHLEISHPGEYRPEQAIVQTNLASLYNESNRYTEAEEMYNEALLTYKQLAASNPYAYEPNLARILAGLASLYIADNRPDESETLYRSALEIYRQLANSNPAAFNPDLAVVLLHLAFLYSDKQHYAESKSLYHECLTIYQQLYDSYPPLYIEALATCHNGLGTLLCLMEENKEAIKYLEKSLALSSQLVKENKLLDIHATTMVYLTVSYFNDKNYDAAYHTAKKSIPLIKNMYLEDPQRWIYYYTGQLINLACCANLEGKFKEGELNALMALKIDSSERFATSNLATSLLFQGKVSEAENLYNQCGTELKSDILEIFAEFERLGVIPAKRKADFQRIKAMLNQ